MNDTTPDPRVLAATTAYLKSVHARNPAYREIVLFEDIAAALAAADAVREQTDAQS